MDRSLLLSLSLRSRQLVERSLLLSLLLRSRQSMNRSLLLSLSLRSRQFVERFLLPSISFCARQLVDHFPVLNYPKWPRFPSSRSRDFICLILNNFGFWPQMPLISGRITSKTIFFLIMGPRASFWYIICLGMKMFGFWPQVTPTPNLQNKKSLSGPKLLFELS